MGRWYSQKVTAKIPQNPQIRFDRRRENDLRRSLRPGPEFERGPPIGRERVDGAQLDRPPQLRLRAPETDNLSADARFFRRQPDRTAEKPDADDDRLRKISSHLSLNSTANQKRALFRPFQSFSTQLPRKIGATDKNRLRRSKTPRKKRSARKNGLNYYNR